MSDFNEIKKEIQNELLKQGWRQCAIGQRTTQYCSMAEQAKLEAKREWQGLTDEEIEEYKWMGGDVIAVIKEIQATLKEKNT